MDLRGYLTALGRNWLMIVLAAVAGLALGLGAYKIMPASYGSSVTFYVATPLSDGTSAQSAGQFAESRVNSYALLLQSERLAEQVGTDTGIAAADVYEHITASAQPSTVLVTATVSTGSADRTSTISRDLATAFPQMVDQLDNQDSQRSTVEVTVVTGPTQTLQIAPSLKKYLALGLFGGALIGVVIALLRELLDVTVRGVETATALVNAPVIGIVDHDNAAKKEPLIVGEVAKTPRAEAFRQLRTNLRYIDSAKQADVLVVTSSLPEEGKSTVASDLALTLVESGSRTLLLDADLRRPSLADIFGLEQGIGLTNVLVGQIAVDEAIQSWGSKGPDVLASGGVPPNPTELLGGDKMQRLMADLRSRYDKIIIDAPPLLPVADAVVASELADGVLFVIRHGKTSRATVVDAARTLHSVEARIVGTVLNMRRLSRRERRHYAGKGYAVLDSASMLSVPETSADAPSKPSRESSVKRSGQKGRVAPAEEIVGRVAG